MIDVVEVSKEFKVKKMRKMAVNKISFSISEGEIVGYIGPNGAGKSTMIKMLCGILTPTSGEIMVNGNNPAKKRVVNAKNIGVVFGQRTQLWWDLPLMDSFKLLKKIYEINDDDFENRLKYLDEIFDISKHYSSLVRTLSLGERMKADIVASMLHNPRILFLDEPTIGLDFASKNNMRKAICEINRRYKTTIILTTHDMRDIEEVCNRIIILDKGKKIYDDTMENLKQKYGETKTIEMNFQSKEIYEKLIKLLERKKEVEIREAGQKLYIIYNKKKTSFYEICNSIIDVTADSDIIIKDASIENIIERIYSENEL